MKTADIVSAVVLLAIAAAAAAGTLDLPYWSEFSPGPAFGARWAAALAAALAAAAEEGSAAMPAASGEALPRLRFSPDSVIIS